MGLPGASLLGDSYIGNPVKPSCQPRSQSPPNGTHEEVEAPGQWRRARTLGCGLGMNSGQVARSSRTVRLPRCPCRATTAPQGQCLCKACVFVGNIKNTCAFLYRKV